MRHAKGFPFALFLFFSLFLLYGIDSGKSAHFFGAERRVFIGDFLILAGWAA